MQEESLYNLFWPFLLNDSNLRHAPTVGGILIVESSTNDIIWKNDNDLTVTLLER